MMNLIITSPFFGVFFTIICWSFGRWVQQKTGCFLLNGLLVAAAVGIVVLVIFDIPYEIYYESASVIQDMLAPATAILAMNIYRQRHILKEYFIPVLVGCLAGSLTSLLSILGLCKLMSMDSVITASLLPKSVTTAIAVSIAESNGGIGGIAVAGVVIAGLMGTIFSPIFAKMFKITDPVAEGLGIGACSHALGTTKALERGEIQGAMSSIALCVCGIMTSILSLFPIFR